MKRMIALMVLTMAGPLSLFSDDIPAFAADRTPFEGEYRYWTDSGDFQSVTITKSGGRYLAELTGGGRTLNLTCVPESGEIVSEPRRDIYYIFRMNGDNELRMRKLYTKRDRPEDIEWIFFRNS